jgi:hypothetical protein
MKRSKLRSNHTKFTRTPKGTDSDEWTVPNVVQENVTADFGRPVVLRFQFEEWVRIDIIGNKEKGFDLAGIEVQISVDPGSRQNDAPSNFGTRSVDATDLGAVNALRSTCRSRSRQNIARNRAVRKLQQVCLQTE